MAFCSNTMNAAKRRYVQGTAGVMSAYVGLVFLSSASAHRWHPKGWHLWIAAALPTIPILCLAFIVGRYLKEETDEYLRDMTIRSLLWATAVTLAVSVFADFLHSYGGTFRLPDFSAFIVFWITMGLVRFLQAIRNRGGEDE